MRLAIIGSGVSGLTCARLLSAAHDVTVFESSDWIGGHAHTVHVRVGGKDVAVDTGFIVFNDRNYPNFEKLLGMLGVESVATSMSFSVRCDRTGLEVFASGGLTYVPMPVILRADDRSMNVKAIGGPVRFESIEIDELGSAWQK
jgi:predicted NAD/FAD-binding protein